MGQLWAAFGSYVSQTSLSRTTGAFFNTSDDSWHAGKSASSHDLRQTNTRVIDDFHRGRSQTATIISFHIMSASLRMPCPQGAMSICSWTVMGDHEIFVKGQKFYSPDRTVALYRNVHFT